MRRAKPQPRPKVRRAKPRRAANEDDDDEREDMIGQPKDDHEEPK